MRSFRIGDVVSFVSRDGKHALVGRICKISPRGLATVSFITPDAADVHVRDIACNELDFATFEEEVKLKLLARKNREKLFKPS